jgi:hypothetical protein
LGGDGMKGPFFVRTNARKLKDLENELFDGNGHIALVEAIIDEKTKKNIAPGERATLAYLQHDM